MACMARIAFSNLYVTIFEEDSDYKKDFFRQLHDITSLFFMHMYVHDFSVILETHRCCKLFKLI